MGNKTTTDISAWCKDSIHGIGGFISFEEHEIPIWHVSREQAIAEFIIRCLGNLENEGSEEVLNKILSHRFKSMHKYKEQKTVSLIERAFLAGRSKTSWEQFKKENRLTKD